MLLRGFYVTTHARASESRQNSRSSLEGFNARVEERRRRMSFLCAAPLSPPAERRNVIFAALTPPPTTRTKHAQDFYGRFLFSLLLVKQEIFFFFANKFSLPIENNANLNKQMGMYTLL